MIGLFRHGKAESVGDEMARPLTAEGIQAMHKMAQELAMNWDLLITSPAERAQQTGIILTNLMPQIEETLYVSSTPSERHIIDIKRFLMPIVENKQAVLVITHEPVMLPLLQVLVGDHTIEHGFKAGEGVIIDGGTYQLITRGE